MIDYKQQLISERNDGRNGASVGLLIAGALKSVVTLRINNAIHSFEKSQISSYRSTLT